MDVSNFNHYNKIFKSKNFLLIAVENKNEIDSALIKNFEQISSKLSELELVSQVFSIIDAPILFINGTSLTNLDGNNIENLTNSKYKIQEVIDEFINNPIYINQIINEEASVFSIIIYLNDNLDLSKAKENVSYQVR